VIAPPYRQALICPCIQPSTGRSNPSTNFIFYFGYQIHCATWRGQFTPLTHGGGSITHAVQPSKALKLTPPVGVGHLSVPLPRKYCHSEELMPHHVSASAKQPSLIMTTSKFHEHSPSVTMARVEKWSTHLPHQPSHHPSPNPCFSQKKKRLLTSLIIICLRVF